jgi:hypothetical protein
MTREIHFHKLLPLSQTIVAIAFGGYGLWLRDSIINKSWLGWNSTLPFHVWPWAFKFAAILNMPAFLAGGLLSWPLDAIRPGLPESISMLPVLLFVPLLWYRIGLWLDQRSSVDKNRNSIKGQWILILAFTAICAVASSVPPELAGYISYIPLGIAIWVLAFIGMKASVVFRKQKLGPAGS